MTEPPDDFVLEGEELQQEGPCVEEGVGRVIVPTKGKLFEDDGSVNVAIIRPCVSRGKRLRGLPPIYEPSMLGRNARVFEDWHMWMGHMSAPMREALEELEEQLQEAALPRRPFSELGGRVIKTWFDPAFRGREDDSNGYRPGAVLGKVIPYPASKAILEADPDGLHVSIAAWPTSARKTSPSWDQNTTGMAIEGFRAKPRGSVDWVLRGGAGGRPIAGGLTEAEELAASALGSLYSLGRRQTTRPEGVMAQIDTKTATAQQLREQLLADNPALAEELGIRAEAAPASPAPSSASTTTTSSTPTLTEADLERRLAEQRTALVAEFTKLPRLTEDDVDTAVEEALAEARAVERHERDAHALIKASGLPSSWQEDLIRRYSVLPSGPSQALLAEEETDSDGKVLSARDVLKLRVAEDIQTARDRIAEVGGRPRVSGLGGNASTTKSSAPANPAFRDFLTESGVDLGDKPDDKVKEIVMEGVS